MHVKIKFCKIQFKTYYNHKSESSNIVEVKITKTA